MEEGLKNKWLDPVLSWIGESTNVEALKDGWAVVETTVTDGDGDGICIYVRDEGDRITMSDDGYFIDGYRPLSDNCLNKDGKARLERAIRIVSNYGIRYEDRGFRMDTTRERYALDFNIFLRALVWVSDFL